MQGKYLVLTTNRQTLIVCESLLGFCHFLNTMQQQEIFKDIPDYEGIYQVSSLGNVKSLKFGKEKILTPCFNSVGYLTVNLYKNGNIKMFQIHQLVAITFLNHKLDGTNKIVVDHINNISTDNRLENLQVISRRENLSKDKKNTTSKYTGVVWHKTNKKWLAKITINGKRKHLGYFINEIDAHDAYQNTLKYLDEIKIKSKNSDEYKL